MKRIAIILCSLLLLSVPALAEEIVVGGQGLVHRWEAHATASLALYDQVNDEGEHTWQPIVQGGMTAWRTLSRSSNVGGFGVGFSLNMGLVQDTDLSGTRLLPTSALHLGNQEWQAFLGVVYDPQDERRVIPMMGVVLHGAAIGQ